jgi:hypothetical protein
MATIPFTLPQHDLLHETSGLIFQYMSEYKPSDSLISFAVTIPVVKDMCYLLPRNSMKKIAQCEKKANDRRRSKRFISDIISIALGTAATSLTIKNSLQMANMQREMQMISFSIETIGKMADNHNSQLIQLSEGQVKIAETLNHTQNALNNTIRLVNEHSIAVAHNRAAINTLSTSLLALQNQFASFAHAVDTHFIHQAIDDIATNKLNLKFIHHEDMPRVIESVLNNTQIQLNETNGALSTIELISKLLVQQRVDFVPTEKEEGDDEFIGNLVFTSFFAHPRDDQEQFAVYKLTAIPFNHDNQRLKLAQLPAVVGIGRETNGLIQWSREEADSCQFQHVSVCRETPPIRTEWERTCLFQILADKQLTECRTEEEKDPIFVQRIGRQWAISTINTTRCHLSLPIQLEEHVVTPNKEIVLPQMALITVDERTAWNCDYFFLPAAKSNTAKNVSIISGAQRLSINKDIIDLQRAINKDRQWDKLPYIPANMQNIVNSFQAKLDATTRHRFMPFWHPDWTTMLAFALTIATIGLVIMYIHATCTNKYKNINKLMMVPSI